MMRINAFVLRQRRTISQRAASERIAMPAVAANLSGYLASPILTPPSDWRVGVSPRMAVTAAVKRSVHRKPLSRSIERFSNASTVASAISRMGM